jgi:hypothetical protein
MSVVRATTATRVNSAGLVELVPYNLLQYSEQFNNAAWDFLNVATITPNSTTAPNGTTTADTITFTASAASCVAQSLTSPQGSVTLSVYAKVASGTKQFRLRIDASGGNSSSNFTATTEWQRFEFNVTISAAGTNFYVINADTATAGSLFIWGAQLVEGTTAKDYQKTETRLNIPRLDYSNGTCPSLLVEPQRTNLLTWSQNLTLWSQTNEIASRQLVANPLTGVNNATKITKTTSGSDPYVGEIQSAVNGTYTYSVYLWTDSGQPLDVTLFMYNSSVSEVYTLNVTLTTTPTRYQYTSTFANTLGAITTRIDLTGASANQYIYVWGAQLEAGSYPTSYIPTTSASVTRNADVVSKTGISSLIGQTEGSVFLDLDYTSNGTNYLLQLGDNTTNFIELYVAGGVLYFSGYNGSAQWSISTAVSTQHYKIAYAYKANDIVLYVNGTLIGTDTSAAIPTCSNLYLNQEFGGLYNQRQFYNASALWTTRLTNTQLELLTGNSFNTYAEMASYYNYTLQ